jgi:hypothetical protein
VGFLGVDRILLADNQMKNISGVAVAWLMWCCCAFAGVIYDNTALITSGGDFTAGITLLNSFSTGGASGALSGLELGLTDSTPSDGGTITVALYGDSTSCAGLGTTDCPGTLITNLATIPDSSLPINATVIPLSLTANPVLSSGTRYWIALNEPDLSSNGPLWENASSVTGTGVSGEFDGGGNYPYTMTEDIHPNAPADLPYVMQVTVGSTASVPEPASLWLCMGGLGAMLIAMKPWRLSR